jgi:hypothetical protein
MQNSIAIALEGPSVGMWRLCISPADRVGREHRIGSQQQLLSFDPGKAVAGCFVDGFSNRTGHSWVQAPVVRSIYRTGLADNRIRTGCVRSPGHSMAIILRQTAYFHTAKGWRAAVSAPNLKIDQTADDCLPQFSIQRLRLNWWLLRERDHSTFSSPSVIFQAAGRRVSFSIGKVSVNER